MGQSLSKVYHYHVWANQRVFKRLKEVPEEILQTEIQSVFPTILDAMKHMYNVDTLWFHVMTQKSFNDIVAVLNELSEEINSMKLSDLEKAYQHIAEQYEEILVSLDNRDQPITCEHPKFGKLDTSIAELVQHVVNHGTYHRGNITAMLRQLGYPGASSDYIFYLYEINEKNK